MCKTALLEQEIAITAAAIEKDKMAIHQQLKSPDCYVLPLMAFVVGIALHKSLPSPGKMMALTAKFWI